MINDCTDARRSGDCATGSDAGGSQTASYLAASLPHPIPSVGGTSSDAACLPSETTPAVGPLAAGGFFWEPTKRSAAPLELLRQWQAEGLTYYAIGKRIGRDASTVQKRLERQIITKEQRDANFAARVAALWARGMTQRQIRDQVRACERRIRAVTKTLPKPQRQRTQAPTPTFMAKCDAFVALVKAGATFSGAREQVGIGGKQYRRLVIQHGLVSPRLASPTPRREKAPPVQRITRAKEAPPNRYRTPAQQAVIAQWKSATYQLTIGRDTRAVPPPPNAEQLIRDAIAAGRVTRCPPAFAAPVNNGAGL